MTAAVPAAPETAPPLDARVRDTLRFLVRNAAEIRNAAANDSRADKAACEIALLCWALMRSEARDDERERIAELVPIIESRLAGETIARALLWMPSHVPMFSMGIALLAAIGCRHSKLLEIAEIAWRRDFHHGREKSPFQQLEDQWSRSLTHHNGAPALPASSIVRRDVFAPMMSIDDAYAFTHTIFYLTDFGGLLPAEVQSDATREALESGALWSLLRGDFDLLGEFLLSALYAGCPWTPPFDLGLTALFAAWDEHGEVPSPGADRSFFGTYHANLVGALLANELRRGMPSRDTILPACTTTIDVEGILAGAAGVDVARRVVTSLSDALLQAIAPDLAIVHGFVSRDIDPVVAGIRAAEGRTPRSWAVCCAIEWLEMTGEVGAVLQSR